MLSVKYVKLKVSLSLKQKKRVTIADYSLVPGTGFFPALRFGKGQNGNNPKKMKSVKRFRVFFVLP